MIFLAFLTYLCVNPSLGQAAKTEATLVLAHVIFRHGNRTPDLDLAFPKNPYKNINFFPVGYGELTLGGKQRAYQLGEILRKRFDKFLGPTYTTDLVEAVSSDYQRTITSLSAVMAGMFPAKSPYKLRKYLNWQPTYSRYIDASLDKMMAGYRSCPKIFDLKTATNKTTRDIYKFLTDKTGLNVNNSLGVFDVQNTILVMEELGHKPPNYIQHLWPEPMKTLALQMWRDMIDQRLDLISGNLLKKINEDSKMKVYGTLKPKARKLFLYSGHDMNVIGFLGAIGKYEGQAIHYSAYVIVEVHKLDGVYGVKLFLGNNDLNNPEAIDVPGCGLFCPLDTFTEMTSKFYPKDPWCT